MLINRAEKLSEVFFEIRPWCQNLSKVFLKSRKTVTERSFLLKDITKFIHEFVQLVHSRVSLVESKLFRPDDRSKVFF